MNQLRTALLIALLALASSRLWADRDDPGRAKITICNLGSIGVAVAAARQISNGRQWFVQGWTKVSPGECAGVAEWHMEHLEGLHYKFANGHPVHIAFAFTDATGVWGAGTLRLTRSAFGLLGGWNEARFGGSDDYDSLQQSDRQLCVARDRLEYVMDGADTASMCTKAGGGGPGSFLIPASVDWENKSDSDLILDVRFGPNDRAIPMGPHSVSSASPTHPNVNVDNNGNNDSSDGILKTLGTILAASREANLKNLEGFYGVLSDSMRSPDAPLLTRTPCTASRRCDNLEFCASQSFFTAHSWANAADATALKRAVRAYVETHTLGSYPPVTESGQTNGTVFLKLAETSDHHVAVEESGQCVNGDVIYNLYSVSLAQEHSNAGKNPVRPPVTAPQPIVSPPSPPSSPNDDPIGDGGFIIPPKAIAPEIAVDVCVPPDLVDKLSWDHPAPNSKMTAFQAFLREFVRNYGKGGALYRITDGAYDRFDRGRLDPTTVFQAVPTGQRCPASNYTYTVTTTVH